MAVNKQKKEERKGMHFPTLFPQRLIRALADEVAEVLLTRLPHMLPRQRRKTQGRGNKKLESGIFLDTSAIIDGRIFDVFHLRLLSGPVIVPESILLELKHIADSQDTVRRERGRKGLEMLEKLKKTRGMKVVILDEMAENKGQKRIEVDEALIRLAKTFKGRIVTCDYNLEKKAIIQGVFAINVNALANVLKVSAVPGEALHIKLSHLGKDPTQGVGYLDDGTMVVVEQAAAELEKTIDVVVSRVIQTSAGRILFAKKI